MKIKIVKDPIWNLHSHSRFSAGDALPKPAEMVAKVVEFGQPALGLTDHGNMAGAVQLYTECSKAGILPFPGVELYVVDNRADPKAKRYHMCVVAYTTEGYVNLLNLSTTSHENFHYKPLVDFNDLAYLSEAGKLRGIAATSGCYFSFISQAIDSDDLDKARVYLKLFDLWFDDFYVELQNHNVDHGNGWTDDLLADALVSLADEIGLPCVLTQDSHYCNPTDKEQHDNLKRLVSFGPDADDAVFPGDGYHLADYSWFSSHHEGRRFRRGAEGLGELLAKHTLVIPELDKYHYNIPFTVAAPDIALAQRCTTEAERRGLGMFKGYKERLNDELQIVKETGMAGYLLMVGEIVQWCKDNGVLCQARGSASGSILCWLLDITQVDPIEWKLSFERFISRDRTKPPDIDLDVEHTRRQELIDYLSTKYSVHQIGTWLVYSLNGDEESGKGSLRVRYFSRKRATGAPIDNWDQVPAEDRSILHQLSAEEAYSAYGVHPAGLVMTTTDTDFNRLVPMMKVASSDTLVTQYPMKDIEKLGLVKLDILGLKTLSVLRQAMLNLDKDPLLGLDWIPLKDKSTFAKIANGYTAGVFQLEGHTIKRAIKLLKPTKVADVVAAVALFRPATMKSGATESYLNRKHKVEPVPARHVIIERHTKHTYGIMLYQEQVMSILRDLGMDPDDLTTFLGAVKASNENIGRAKEVIEEYRPLVKQLADQAGMDDLDWLWLWNAIEGFGNYGFNQAHSTAYGLTAYRCAYLATNHSLEFFAALLAINAGTKKEREYIAAARDNGLRVLAASANDSQATYSVDPKRRGIRKGLNSVKGVGDKSAEEIVNNRPAEGYLDLEHLCRSVNHRRVSGAKAFLAEQDDTVGVIGKLKEASAFDCFKEYN